MVTRGRSCVEAYAFLRRVARSCRGSEAPYLRGWRYLVPLGPPEAWIQPHGGGLPSQERDREPLLPVGAEDREILVEVSLQG